MKLRPHIWNNQVLSHKELIKYIMRDISWAACNPRYTSKIGQCFLYFCTILSTLVVASMGLNLFFAPAEELNSLIQQFIMFSGFTQVIAKYFVYIIYKNIFAEIINSMYDEFWSLEHYTTESNRQAGIKRYQLGKNMENVINILGHLVVSFFCIKPLFIGNKTLILDIWVPNMQLLKTSPYFEIAYATEVFVYVVGGKFVAIGFDRLFVLSTLFVCEQFKIIKYKLAQLNSENFDFKIVKECITQHNKILKYINNIETVYSKILLVTFASDFMLSSLDLFGVAFAKDYHDMIPNLLLYFYATSILFMYCLSGQLLQNESFELREVAYAIDWYALKDPKQSREIKIAIILILIRTQREIELSAGGLVTLSLQSFATIMRATLSLLTFILHVK